MIPIVLFTRRCHHLYWNWNFGKLRQSHFNMDGGRLWTLPRNVLSAKKVKVSMTRCKTQTSLCVFSSYSTSWLKMYQAPQLWTSSSIRMHEIKTSRSTELRNCQGKKTHKQTNEKTGFKKNWITCEISIILSPVFPHSDRNCKRSARSKVASGKWITK